MSNRIEFGVRALRSSVGTFPFEWGLPPGDAMSEERARWVREKVQQHMRSKPWQQLARRQAEQSEQWEESRSA